jgi:hypothetical protein
LSRHDDQCWSKVFSQLQRCRGFFSAGLLSTERIVEKQLPQHICWLENIEKKRNTKNITAKGTKIRKKYLIADLATEGRSLQENSRRRLYN